MFPEMIDRNRAFAKQVWQRHYRPRRRRPRRFPSAAHRLPGLLPTLLTLSNGICGLSSIVVATGAIVEMPRTTAIFYAAILVYLGMLFDMLDGQVARGLKQTSAFGAQLDSLCDAITFGVAPVFVLLSFHDFYNPRLLFGIGIVFVACVLLRLARFNVETGDTDSHDVFSGLPSPAAAGTVVSFALIMPKLESWSLLPGSGTIQHVGTWLIAVVMVTVPLLSLLLALLMVSRVEYRHVVNRWLGRRYGFYQLTCAVLLFITAVVVHELALPLAFCLFAIEPACGTAWKSCRANKPAVAAAAQEPTR